MVEYDQDGKCVRCGWTQGEVGLGNYSAWENNPHPCAMTFNAGEKIWTLKKGEFQERTVYKTDNPPFHVYTDLEPGEPTSNPKTGMFITFHDHLKLEVGRTKFECLENRTHLENQRIERAKADIKKSRKKLERYQEHMEQIGKELQEELEVGDEVLPNIQLYVGDGPGRVSAKRFADHKTSGVRVYEARFQLGTYIFGPGELRKVRK